MRIERTSLFLTLGLAMTLWAPEASLSQGAPPPRASDPHPLHDELLRYQFMLNTEKGMIADEKFLRQHGLDTPIAAKDITADWLRKKGIADVAEAKEKYGDSAGFFKHLREKYGSDGQKLEGPLRSAFEKLAQIEDYRSANGEAREGDDRWATHSVNNLINNRLPAEIAAGAGVYDVSPGEKSRPSDPTDRAGFDQVKGKPADNLPQGGSGKAAGGRKPDALGERNMERLLGFERGDALPDPRKRTSDARGFPADDRNSSDPIRSRAFDPRTAPELVRRAYQAFLSREPEAGVAERASRAFREQGMAGWMAFLTGITSSPEFKNGIRPRFSDEKLLTSIYANMLGRGVDPDGRRAYLSLLGEGRIAEVAEGVGSSDEFLSALDKSITQKPLPPGPEPGRPADPPGEPPVLGGDDRAPVSRPRRKPDTRSETEPGDPPATDAPPRGATQCAALPRLIDGTADASGALQDCIDRTPPNGTLELAPGVYRVSRQIRITRPLTLKTEGKSPSDPRCGFPHGEGCAQLKATAALELQGTRGFFVVAPSAAGTTIDHLVFNGDRSSRMSSSAAAACRPPVSFNGAGMNLHIEASNLAFTNNLVENAVCGAGLEFTPARNARIEKNTFANNGVHDQEGLWSDGLTIHRLDDSAIKDNEFIDNTDVDLIFGGCSNCVIQRNTIRHTASFAGSAFAALMIHSWPPGPGVFTGADVSRNTVDCGPSRGCGFGLLIGGDPWYMVETYGGSYHDNSVANAQQGFAIAHANDIVIYNNRVSGGGGSFMANCGERTTYARSISGTSFNIDRTRDDPSLRYESVDWTGCILNWWDVRRHPN